MTKALIFGIAAVAALGGFVYGVDSGIISTTMSETSFKLKMYGSTTANASLSGAIVSVYNAGQAVGSLTAGWLSNRISRKYAIFLAAVLAILGAALQSGSTGVGMMIAGRLIAGTACGMLLSVVPVYIAELAPPAHRGFMVGLQGMMTAIGFMVANWIGYGGSYAVDDAQWRIPLAMQCPGPLALAVGVVFLPFSPRWLVQQDRHEDARRVLQRFHPDALVEQELVQIHDQMQFERVQARDDVSWLAATMALFSLRYLRRTALAAFVLVMSQLSGSSVIQNFQTVFYATAGFTGQAALLISGVYGLMGVAGQVVYLVVVADRWPRARTMWTGSLVLSAMIAVCMGLSAAYGDESNVTGARGAIAFIFLYSVCYAVFFNAMVWVVSSELFPFWLRSTGMAAAVFIKAVFAIVLSQVTPVALDWVGWRYYALFVATNAAAAGVYYFFLPETSGKSLEEIAELFGDSLVTGHIGDADMDKRTEGLGLELDATEPREERERQT